MMQQQQDSEARSKMTSYWKEHSVTASEKEMMLDSNAEEIGKHEIPEILQVLPDIQGKNVLELGAGIGRFTGHLASKAQSVTAVDFMENFLNKNKEVNGHHGNVEFLRADATTLDFPADRFDMVFSNWLLMYLSDNEVHALFTKILRWLRPGGYFFFRESCFHKSGDRHLTTNPSNYRDPSTYNALLQTSSVAIQDCSRDAFIFEIVLTRAIQTYIRLKSNCNQICWLVQKSCKKDYHGYSTFQQFLDNKQYSMDGIKRYEYIFGKNFLSTGGIDTTEEFLKLLDLKSGQTVLDVGSGLGGSAFYMAERHDVHVIGIDLSSNMVAISLKTADQIGDARVQFEVGDATKRDFAPKSFDVIYSRDTILHIEDKEKLFSAFLKWLKPSGKLLISDYCAPDGEWTEEYTNYVKDRGYHLLTVAQYGELLKKVGFTKVKADDKTERFVETLQFELKRLENVKENFVKELSQAEYDKLVELWKIKIHRSSKSNQKWGLMYAEKSL